MRSFLLLCLVLSTLEANHISWSPNFDKAHKEALKQEKKLMVLLIEENSKACQEALKTTFMNQPYIDEINREFISIIVSKNQKSSYPIEMLYTFTYPTLFFLDNTELFVCEPIRGGISPDKLKSYLERCK